MALPIYAITLFASAFLLFLVQPIIGKIILPNLGGAPQVWNTCMVFFQVALLAGYAYTHTTSTRLTLRQQLGLHCLLLFVPFVALTGLLAYPFGGAAALGRPFDDSWWIPPSGANPIPSTLFLLTIIVGLPFFVVATSAPLLQKWFVHTGHPSAKDPYFLYAASNIGSMGALLAYPFIIEPLVGLSVQSYFWMAGYVVLIGLVLLCASMVWKPAPTPASLREPDMPTNPAAADPSTAIQKPARLPHAGEPGTPAGGPADASEVTPWRRLRWIALAAVPSSLMLGITTHFTTDLSPVPLFWLIPLTLYLLTFILVFARWPVVWTGLPHTIVLYIQPFLLVFMIWQSFTEQARDALEWPIFVYCMAFFLTTMVCHGELARDRPSPRYLTEFYLWMSVGGALGGIFNGLIAPLFFKFGAWEFPIAIVLAGLLRPNIWRVGIIETMINEMAGKPRAHIPHAAKKGPKGKQKPHKQEIIHTEESSVVPPLAFDIGLPLVLGAVCFLLSATVGEHQDWRLAVTYLLPLALCCVFLDRGLRFGLAIAAIMGVHALRAEDRSVVYRDRSYFGIISVREYTMERGRSERWAPTEYQPQSYTNLLHGSTDHGMNFRRPTNKSFRASPENDLSRLPTTYYHRLGPTGLAMEKFAWFHEPMNHYWSDNRMLASMVGACASPFASLNTMADVWSEPPYAVIGLGTGTMASYARPFQHCHFYEIDNQILRLSLPIGGDPYFTYLRDAEERGAFVQVLMGDARLRMAKPYEPYNRDKERAGDAAYGGPDHFYHLMVVDAFSSDAIPMHLLTKEAFQLYFKKLAPEGVLCVHTSNRHVDLVKVVADVTSKVQVTDPYTGKEHNLIALRGHDNAPPGLARDTLQWELAPFADANEERRERLSGGIGHYTSEWVMVFRDDAGWETHLEKWTPADYDDKQRESLERKYANRNVNITAEPYWETPRTFQGKYVWTDDYSNIIAVLRDATTIYMLVGLFVAIIVGVAVIIIITKTSKQGDLA